MLLAGEAGIGKTAVCEQLATGLALATFSAWALVHYASGGRTA